MTTSSHTSLEVELLDVKTIEVRYLDVKKIYVKVRAWPRQHASAITSIGSSNRSENGYRCSIPRSRGSSTGSPASADASKMRMTRRLPSLTSTTPSSSSSVPSPVRDGAAPALPP